MCVKLQRKSLIGLLVLCLLVVGPLTRAFAAPRLFPLVDRPGQTAYCDRVAVLLGAANTTVDLLLSDARLDGNPLWEPVFAAASRGVRIRVLLDASDWEPAITQKNRPVLDALLAHGIEARFDDPAVTTHAKLVVIDRETVVLGSTNWNRYAFEDQEQANLVVVDPRVGDAFATYFDRLWDGSLFPKAVRLDLGFLDETEACVVALPETDGTLNYPRVLLTVLAHAVRSVHVVMYRMSYYATFSDSRSNDLLHALVAAAGRGLDVRVVTDDCAYYPDSADANWEAAAYLVRHGVSVRMDDPDETTHAKLVIVDGKHTLLGSTNWNYYSLERNNEVDVAVLGVPALAAPYEGFFTALWEGGRAPPSLGDRLR
jgi:phosphatidylserine/phosphatidylglycerophosphate/cardiolipin synthase-like enzyme